MPSTRRSDSIRLDLPLGGRPRYGDDFARSRTAPAPVSRETLSLPPAGTNPRSADSQPKRHFPAVIAVVREPRGAGPSQVDRSSVDHQEVAIPAPLLEQHVPSLHQRIVRKGQGVRVLSSPVHRHPATGHCSTGITSRGTETSGM